MRRRVLQSLPSFAGPGGTRVASIDRPLGSSPEPVMALLQSRNNACDTRLLHWTPGESMSDNCICELGVCLQV
eukprot:6102949-Amphidinium_carterae.1